VKVPILFGAVFGLLVASLYMWYQLDQIRDELATVHHRGDQVRDELAQTRNQLLAEIAKMHETSSASTGSVDLLKAELEAAQKQARALAGAAKVSATKHADELAAKLAGMQQEQAQKVAAVSDVVSQVKTDADATRSRVGEVSSEVGSVKAELTATKSELDKTIADLKTTKGDLGVQSGLIATNAKELMVLKQLGERNYTEFTLPKEKAPRKIGDIRIRLRATDPKRNRYSIEVMADDKVFEKKDKTVNEPVQFMLARSPQPYELVINEVKKDAISGYVAAPKAAQARN
jgi:chromosome segregation ATPase